MSSFTPYKLYKEYTFNGITIEYIDKEEIVFTSGASMSINLVAYGYAMKHLKKDMEIFGPQVTEKSQKVGDFLAEDSNISTDIHFQEGDGSIWTKPVIDDGRKMTAGVVYEATITVQEMPILRARNVDSANKKLFTYKNKALVGQGKKAVAILNKAEVKTE